MCRLFHNDTLLRTYATKTDHVRLDSPLIMTGRFNMSMKKLNECRMSAKVSIANQGMKKPPPLQIGDYQVNLCH